MLMLAEPAAEKSPAGGVGALLELHASHQFRDQKVQVGVSLAVRVRGQVTGMPTAVVAKSVP